MLSIFILCFSFNFRSSIVGRLDKSEIIESVETQLRHMFKKIQESGDKIVCLKMNIKTRDKFRVFFSYDVETIQKSDNHSIGNVIGSIQGVKIVQDDELEVCKVQPIVENKNIRSKIDMILFDKKKQTQPRQRLKPQYYYV